MRALLHQAALLVTALAALGMPRAGQAASHDRLVIGLASFPSDMHPFVSSLTVKNYIEAASRRTVTRYDGAGQLICQLCTEVPTVANGRATVIDLPDGSQGMEVTFTLRPDLKWGDGSSLTTRDVLFGAEVERQLAPPPGVIGVTAADALSYTVKLKTMRYDFSRLSPSPINATIEEPILHAAKDPLDYAAKSAFNRAPETPGLWNGPYLVTGFKSNDSVTFIPNPYWDGEKPGFQQVTMRLIDNSAAQVANLLSGDIDISYGLSLDQALDLRKRYADQFDITFADGLSTTSLYVQIDNPVLADKRVRQAIMLGIDRQTIVTRLFEGKFPVARSFIAPADPAFDTALKPWPYDPDRARALLKDAGYTAATDGILARADGARLVLDFRGSAGFRTGELIEQVIQSEMRQIGIDLVIHNEPVRNLLGDTMQKRKFDGLILMTWLTSPDSIPYMTYSSAGIPRQSNNFAGYNYDSYSTPQMDSLLSAALKTLDPAVRQPLWNDIQKLVMEDLPIIPLYNSSYFYLSPKWMTGMIPIRSTYVATLWIEYWKPK